jgi:hypothetical protein
MVRAKSERLLALVPPGHTASRRNHSTGVRYTIAAGRPARGPAKRLYPIDLDLCRCRCAVEKGRGTGSILASVGAPLVP